MGLVRKRHCRTIPRQIGVKTQSAGLGQSELDLDSVTGLRQVGVRLVARVKGGSPRGRTDGPLWSLL